jgi:hypothetical protein
MTQHSTKEKPMRTFSRILMVSAMLLPVAAFAADVPAPATAGAKPAAPKEKAG